MTDQKKTKAPKKKTASKASAPKPDVKASEAATVVPSPAPKTQAPSHPAGHCLAPKRPRAGNAVGGK